MFQDLIDKLRVSCALCFFHDLSDQETKHLEASGRVLLMDDDDMVCEVAGDMLLTMGFTVDRAAHGEQALKLARQAADQGQAYDLVIMDLTVQGGMGGMAATRSLLEQHPDAKVIVASGYSNDPVLGNYQEHGFAGRISKPYRLRELSRTIEQVLSE